MKILNKHELQRTEYNQWSDIGCEDFMNFYKKTCSFLIIDATLTLNNRLWFRKNLLERIKKLIMTIDDKIRDEKLQYDINRKAVKLSALSSGKIAKYEYLTSEEILSSNQR